MGASEEERDFHFYPNTVSTREKKVFERKRNYRSGVIGMGVRLGLEMVFEEGWNFHLAGLEAIDAEKKARKGRRVKLD